MPQYDFSQLSPMDFEGLTAGVLQAEWNLALEAFKSGRDGGIDLRYSRPNGRNDIVVQCKHYLKSGLSKLKSKLERDERPKLDKIKPQRYVLVTSLGLTPHNKDEIQAILHPYVVSTGDVIGQTEINALLDKHPQVEMANFKLWLTSKAVLDRAIYNAEISQADFEIERIRRRLPLYVQNNCYPRALNILETNRFVIISGEPGVGKTTLAEIVLYTYLSNGYAPVVVKTDLREGRSLFNKAVPQIFYYDDFLGQTFLRERHGFLLKNEDAALADFVEMVQQSEKSKLVLTTREHIFSNAIIGSERLRRSALVDYRCLLEVRDYSRAEKARILYNHIYFSELPDAYQAELIEDQFYELVLNHRNFNPRLIEWLSTYRRVKSIPASQYRAFIESILENPEEIWQNAYLHQISDAARSLLLSLFSLGGRVSIKAAELAWIEMHNHQSSKYRYPISRDGFYGAVKEVDGSFIIVKDGMADFINPSIKDFLGRTVASAMDSSSDLVDGAVFLDQLYRLWQIAKEHNQSQTNMLQTVVRTERFVQSVKRTLDRSHRENAEAPGGGAAIDLRPEARLRALVQMAFGLSSAELWDLIPAAAERVLTNWDGEHPNFEEICDALCLLEQHDHETTLERRAVYARLRERMFEEISDTMNGLDFKYVDTFMYEDSKQPCSVGEMEQFNLGFDKYLRDYFDDDLADANSSAEHLDELGRFMSKLIDERGFHVNDQFEQISNAVAELEEHSSRAADDLQDHWRDLRAQERADDETIARMFDSLRD